MIDIKIEIRGLEKLREAMQRAPEKTVEEVSLAVQKSIMVYKSQAIKEAPVNKSYGGGNLRQNIREKMINKVRGMVTSFAPYSIFVEGGTIPHDIYPRSIGYRGHPGGLGNKRTGFGVYNKVHHPGTRANPFMQRALDKTQFQMTEFFKTAIKNVFDSLKN